MRNVMRWNKHGWLAGNVVSGTPHGPRSTIARGSVELFGRDSFVMLGAFGAVLLALNKLAYRSRFDERLVSFGRLVLRLEYTFYLSSSMFPEVRLRGGSSSGERTFELMWEGSNQCDMRFAGFGGVVEQCSPVVHIGNNHRILTVGDW